MSRLKVAFSRRLPSSQLLCFLLQCSYILCTFSLRHAVPKNKEGPTVTSFAGQTPVVCAFYVRESDWRAAPLRSRASHRQLWTKPLALFNRGDRREDILCHEPGCQ